MRFFDKANFSLKIKELSKNRNVLINYYVKAKGGPEILVIVPIFIGAFYQSIEDDRNTSEVFHTLANTSESNLAVSERFLAFFLFWSLDRFFDHNNLQDEKILLGLRAIWGWDKDLLSESVERFNNMDSNEVIDSIIRIISKIVGEDFDSIFVTTHLTNALKFSVLKFNLN